MQASSGLLEPEPGRAKLEAIYGCSDWCVRMGEATETADGKHLWVEKRRMGVADAGLGGIVVGKGGRKKVVAVHDAVAEVMEERGDEDAGERPSVKEDPLLENAEVSRQGLAENQFVGPMRTCRWWERDV